MGHNFLIINLKDNQYLKLMDNLKFIDIVSKTREKSSFALEYLTQLYNYYNDNLKLPIKCSNPLACIKCFIPLPTRFLLSEQYTNEHSILKSLNNTYEFHGEPGNRLVYADKSLPYFDKVKTPIPFSFPVYGDNNVEILLSNVYYYEVTIEKKINNKNWEAECVSIGFGHSNTKFNTHVGWQDDSIGFHSDDGTIRFNCMNKSISITRNWGQGDIAGSGLIYVNKNEVQPFFTFNGNLIYISEKPIKINQPYLPIIGYDHSHSIKLNFSNSKFKFNIKKFINEKSDKIISTNNDFIEYYDISPYLNDIPHIPKKIIHPETGIISPFSWGPSTWNLLHNNLVSQITESQQNNQSLTITGSQPSTYFFNLETNTWESNTPSTFNFSGLTIIPNLFHKF